MAAILAEELMKLCDRSWLAPAMHGSEVVRPQIESFHMMFKLTTPHSYLAAFLPVALALGAGTAHAQSAPPAPQGPQDPYDPDDDDADEPDDAAPQNSAPIETAPVQPPTAQPRQQPPAPPAAPPALPQAQVQVQGPVQAQPSATGQWVYTQQYGWIWMPYGDQYAYTPQDTGGTVYPSEYVYYPAYGWTWISAPWIWGWGPRVYFSVGPRFYGWFHHPFVRRPLFGRGVGVRGFRGGAPLHGGFRGHISGSGGHFSGSGGHFSGGHFSGGHSSGGHFSGGHSSGGHSSGGHGRH
jgi:hypothetical protein